MSNQCDKQKTKIDQRTPLMLIDMGINENYGEKKNLLTKMPF